jgi:hypothetical protein
MFQSSELIDNRRLILPEVVMTNLYIAQAVATERIRQLHLEAQRDRRSQAARAGRPAQRPAARLHQAWSFAVSSPRRLRAFVLDGQLGPSYQPNCI